MRRLVAALPNDDVSESTGTNPRARGLTKHSLVTRRLKVILKHRGEAREPISKCCMIEMCKGLVVVLYSEGFKGMHVRCRLGSI